MIQDITSKHISCLLILGGLIAGEVKGQWASPSLNPTLKIVNPAVIAWKTKSTISLAAGYGNGYQGDYAYQEKSTTVANFVLAGELRSGVNTGLQLYDQKEENKISYDDGSSNDVNKHHLQYRTGAASIGPLALGYTDTGKYTLDQQTSKIRSNTKSTTVLKGEAKNENSGISIRLGGDQGKFFFSVFENKDIREYDFSEIQTLLSDSSQWSQVKATVPDVETKKTGFGLGIIFGKEGGNRYKLEAFQMSNPEIKKSANFESTSSSGESQTSTSELQFYSFSSYGFALEADVKKYIFTIGGTFETEYDKGKESNMNYGNTESQRFNSYIYMPLFNPIHIGLYAGTFEKTQLYSNGARRKYETLDEFGLIISYQI